MAFLERYKFCWETAELFVKEFQAPRHQFTQNLLGQMALQKPLFRGALKKYFLKVFLKLRRTHQHCSLFFDKVADCMVASLLKKDSDTDVLL